MMTGLTSQRAGYLIWNSIFQAWVVITGLCSKETLGLYYYHNSIDNVELKESWYDPIDVPDLEPRAGRGRGVGGEGGARDS